MLVSTTSVNAQFSCDPGQTILRLSGQSNAHAEVYDGSNYGVEICYNEIFGEDYTGGNVHTCVSGENTPIVSLSASTNAHLEIPNENNYNTDVCFGDLHCQAVPASQSCEALQGKEIISLSGRTNAHAEINNSNLYEGTGDYKICCGQGFIGTFEGDISNAEWRDFLGNEIGSSNVNNTVILFAQTSFAEGASVTFDIFEDDTITGDDEVLLDVPATVEQNGIVRLEWKINDEHMLDTDSESEFYFIIRESISGSEVFSTDFPQGFDGVLTVLNQEGSNDPPTAVISGPLHKQIYFEGVGIEFSHDSFDPQGDALEVEWTIVHDGQVESTSGEDSFTLAFSDGGMRTITLRVTDDEGLYDEDQIAILVASSPGLLSFINDPWHQQIISDDSDQEDNLEHRVSFSAEDSYVIISDETSPCPNVECIVGNCPSQVEAPPVACGNDIQITNSPLDFSEVDFNWTFKDVDDDSNFEAKINEKGKVSGEVLFSTASKELNDKKIELTMSYESPQTGQLEESIEREFTLGQCLNGGNSFYVLDEAGNVIDIKDTSEPGACTGDGDWETLHNNCCPGGQVCRPTSEGSPIVSCIFPEGELIDSCSDYTTRASCETDEAGVTDGSEPLDPAWTQEECVDTPGRQCACTWDNEVNECSFTVVSGDFTGGSACVNTCVLDYEQTECTNGYMQISPAGNFIQGSGCGLEDQARVDSDRDLCVNQEVHVVPCGRLNFELGFFDYTQFMITGFMIVFIYLFIILRNKNEKKR